MDPEDLKAQERLSLCFYSPAKSWKEGQHCLKTWFCCTSSLVLAIFRELKNSLGINSSHFEVLFDLPAVLSGTLWHACPSWSEDNQQFSSFWKLFSFHIREKKKENNSWRRAVNMPEWPEEIRWMKWKKMGGKNAWNPILYPALPRAGGPTFGPGAEIQPGHAGIWLADKQSVPSGLDHLLRDALVRDFTKSSYRSCSAYDGYHCKTLIACLSFFFFPFFCVLHPSAVLGETLSWRAQQWFFFFSKAITITHHSLEDDKYFNLMLVLRNVVGFFPLESLIMLLCIHWSRVPDLILVAIVTR